MHHRRMHLAVALGVAAATAVLTGALLVGDSMRLSLRGLALDRLGQVEQVLIGERFFRAELAAELARDAAVQEQFTAVEPVLLLHGSVEAADGGRHAGRVQVLGCRDPFWELGTVPLADDGKVQPATMPGDDGILLNQPLAEQLGVRVNDAVLLKLGRPGAVAADSLLGHKTDTVETKRLTVRGIVPAQGLGAFQLRFSQQTPRNAFVSLATLQGMLDQPGQANAALLAGRDLAKHDRNAATAATTTAADDVLRRALRPTLADLGVTVRRGRVPEEKSLPGQPPVVEYFDITSDQLLLPSGVETATAAAFGATPQPVLTYLANTIAVAREGKTAQIPYSTVAAVDATEALGPLDVDVDGRPVGVLADDEIVVTSWVRDDFAAQRVTLRPGDRVRLDYFEPETTHGAAQERSTEFRLRAIVPLAKAGERPRRTNDRQLTPTVKGVTDQASMSNWRAPFEYHAERVRPADDQYWKDHRATPKAFVSLATGRKLWGSRFGKTTSLRLPVHVGADEQTVGEQLRAKLDPAALGLRLQPLRRQALAASGGTTPFEALFLGFSMFVIAAAVLLIVLLFRLGVERRGAELGLLQAVGWPAGRVRRLFLGEGLIVAALGAAAGLPGGMAYAWLMVAGLTTWWVDAIRSPFLRFHATPGSLAIGYASGLCVAAGAIAWTLWRMRRQSAQGLLSGRSELAADLAPERPTRGRWLPIGLFVAAAGMIVLGGRLGGEAQAGAFFGSGALVLTALVLVVRQWLRRAATAGGTVPFGNWPLVSLAARNAARHPGRSVLSIALVAAATFLIVAISTFRQAPTAAGAGGFTHWIECDEPLYHDLGDAKGRKELGFEQHDAKGNSTAEEQLLAQATTLSIRARRGDDASCLNLYQTTQPRVLGLPTEIAQQHEFAWAAWEGVAENPWTLLETSANGEPIPVVLDVATATYSLHLGLGDTLSLDDGYGGKATCRIVGLLKNSIFQGDVLMNAANFRRVFPRESGFRVLLARSDDSERLAATLTKYLGDYGLTVERTDARLAALLAVQNTYLSTFQSLGALGLLLGTVGMAAVQLRSVWERRRELALLSAAGFSRRRIGQLVLWENGAILAAALAVGCLAAGAAVGPHFLAGGAGIPWITLAILLAIIFVTGVAATWTAIRGPLTAPIVTALRGD